MSNFKDPLDAIIAKHEAAAKGEAVEKTDETVVPQVPVPPVPDKIILPTGEPIPTPETKAPIEIDYGDDDQDAEIAAEEAERDAMRQAAVEEAAAKRAEEKKTIMPPDSHDPNVMADFANYQTEKVAVVTTMVNKVIAKYHITEGAIPELPDLMNNVKGRREVMGDLIEYFDTHTDNEITPEFEAIILNNWIMPSGEKASVWIKNPHPTYNTPEEEAEAKAKPSVQVNEKLEVVPQITINVPEGSDVTVNVDADVVRNMSESRKVDIVVNKISEKEMKMDIIYERKDV